MRMENVPSARPNKAYTDYAPRREANGGRYGIIHSFGMIPQCGEQPPSAATKGPLGTSGASSDCGPPHLCRRRSTGARAQEVKRDAQESCVRRQCGFPKGLPTWSPGPTNTRICLKTVERTQ